MKMHDRSDEKSAIGVDSQEADAPRPLRPTIYDVARLAGASPSTVSAVLSGKSLKRRIPEATQLRVRAAAEAASYRPNLQARGLRRARSGLVGMIIPVHENRFFSALSQSFDTIARERQLVPVIASTLRNSREEARVVENLVSYKVESLFIAGADDPEALGRICVAAGLPHVFVDLPGGTAASVVTDNRGGARMLTARLIGDGRGRPYFLGGSAADFATAGRLAAFRDEARARGAVVDDEQMIACGYSPRAATVAMRALHERLGGLPSALFVNSLTVFEGVMSHLADLPAEAFAHCAVGCFDYDPLAAFLRAPVTMVRQNAEGLIRAAYELLEAHAAPGTLVEIAPDLVDPRTIFRGQVGELG